MADNLSKRMECVVSMVTPGLSVADVGCDHAFVSIALVKRNIAPFALAMDVNEGPLKRAEEHIEEAGLKDRISVRISDGLKEFSEGEALSLIIAGMGGKLINRILGAYPSKTASFSELILSPQSEIDEVRISLYGNGYVITDEDMVCEDGKYYVVIKAVPAPVSGARSCEVSAHKAVPEMTCKEETKTAPHTVLTREEALFGPCLLRKRHSVLYEYLLKEKDKHNKILCKLNEIEQTDDIIIRIAEIRGELQAVENSLKQWGNGGVYGKTDY